MNKVLKMLYSGNFNKMHCEHHSDGSQTITLRKNGESVVYEAVVKNLYKENEAVISSSTKEIGVERLPKYIKDRMEEAQRGN